MLQLYLWHDFYNTIFKIKYKLYIASWSAPPPLKKDFWCSPDQISIHVAPYNVVKGFITLPEWTKIDLHKQYW
jgi:hypothetical protein